MRQATFAQSASIAGVALHCGEASHVTIHPLPVDSGVSFRHNGVVVAAELANVGDMSANTTVLSAGGVEIRSVEHLLSALYSVGITNCLIDVEGANEIPFLDGSARPWIELFLSMGVARQEARREVLEVKSSVQCAYEASQYHAYPHNGLAVECSINFKHTIIGHQQYAYEHSLSNYLGEIALARSFLREPTDDPNESIDHIRKRLKGFAYDRGHEATVILYNQSRYFTELRCEKEPVRHKILDFLGDMSLLGEVLKAKFVIVRPSHRANVRFAAYLREQVTRLKEEAIGRSGDDEPAEQARDAPPSPAAG